MGSESYEVAIVGAGPVGLSLALGLARHGRRVLVLEQNASTSERSRAPAIWPRTQEILADLGVQQTFQQAGLCLPLLRPWDADGDRRLLRLPLRELRQQTRFPHLLILPQSRTEALLRRALDGEPSVRLRFGARVDALEERGDAVRVEWSGSDGTGSASAGFLVGCDGAHSTVRHALEASFDGQTYPLQAALADVRLQPDPELPFPRISTRAGLAVGIRLDSHCWRLILPTAQNPTVPLERRIGRAVVTLFGAVRHSLLWSSGFQLHQRLSSCFARGRIALAGDAAHLNSPVGGQGMNAGIQDAEVLCQALLAAIEQQQPAPLHSYAERRRQQIASGVNTFTDRLTRLLLLADGRLIKAGMRVTDCVTRIGPLRRRLLRRLAMLD